MAHQDHYILKGGWVVEIAIAPPRAALGGMYLHSGGEPMLLEEPNVE